MPVNSGMCRTKLRALTDRAQVLRSTLEGERQGTGAGIAAVNARLRELPPPSLPRSLRLRKNGSSKTHSTALRNARSQPSRAQHVCQRPVAQQGGPKLADLEIPKSRVRGLIPTSKAFSTTAERAATAGG